MNSQEVAMENISGMILIESSPTRQNDSKTYKICSKGTIPEISTSGSSILGYTMIIAVKASKEISKYLKNRKFITLFYYCLPINKVYPRRERKKDNYCKLILLQLMQLNYLVIIKSVLLSAAHILYLMGNNTPTIISTSEGKLQHPRLGLIQIVQNLQYDPNFDDQTPQLLLVQSFNISRAEYNQWKQQLQLYTETQLVDKQSNKTSKRKNRQQSHKKQHITEQIKELIFLPVSCSVKQYGYCGSACHLEILYPNYSIVLRDEIKDRSKVQKFYSETQLWYLLYNLIHLERYLQSISTKIGNIHPNNILMNQKNGVMKIIATLSLPKQKDNFQIICESQFEDVFLAPQQIDSDSLKKYKYPPGVNPNKAQIFSIGMTVLQVGTLQLSTYLYDHAPYRINFTKLKNNLTNFKSRYGAHLSNTLEGMLAQLPKNRKTSLEIYQMLKPYENDILNLQPFSSKMFNKSHSRYTIKSSRKMQKSKEKNDSPVRSSIKLMNSQMFETKIIKQFPPQYNYQTKIEQNLNKNYSHNLYKSGNNSLFHPIDQSVNIQSKYLSKFSKKEQGHFYSPRNKRSAFAN